MMVYLLKILYFVYHNVLWDNICNHGLHKHRCYLDECTILISRYILIYGVLINLLQDHDNASSCPPVTHSMGSWIDQCAQVLWCLSHQWKLYTLHHWWHFSAKMQNFEKVLSVHEFPFINKLCHITIQKP